MKLQDGLFLPASFAMPEAGAQNKMLVGDLDGDGRMELLMVQADGGIDDRYAPHQTVCLTAYDLDGKLLWQKGRPAANPGRSGSDFPAQIADIDGDGCIEVLCVMDKRFLVLDGATGETKRSFPLPGPEAHDCILIANLSGGEYASDILLKDRYRNLWALDRDFNLLWTHEGNLGHFPWVHDWDGDGRDEVMAGYDMLGPDGAVRWSCRDLDDHADCIWTGDVDGSGEERIVIGGSVTVMLDRLGAELWRYDGSIESQHVSLGRFRDDMPGLQVAGLDRIVRGDTDGSWSESGRDAIFLLDREGRELWTETRRTPGWLTIVETLRGWDDSGRDYILAYRRGGGIRPTLYDGHLREALTFPVDGLAVHADLTGSGRTHMLLHNEDGVFIYASSEGELKASNPGVPLVQPRRLSRSTLYPGGEYRLLPPY
ncbi:FG-GAP-like repeat-containing protein [Saccharibacillus sp. CPCC 101409]|uniref:FG-GAP-like repeat-containing protein n=1 Tax=Saccharibacillus sp. CPCC 101409 TaxID=3058041 RepID=UPI0026732B75|nr:FG-GAP-like repeat-containing protein [Saccharibacillus sp. CPCC 101409]MDO3411873.1 FG-GAP-like repeat-containing protein [Saccharibacillus sp. CPCC 101409]